MVLTGSCRRKQNRIGKINKKTAAGRDVKNMSSNKRVKSKARQSILMRGPKRLSACNDQHKLVAIGILRDILTVQVNSVAFEDGCLKPWDTALNYLYRDQISMWI